jgi:uncharacterized membrane protein
MSTQNDGLSARDERRGEPDRMLTFSDGVFAIIITILVLELEVPDLSSGQSLVSSLEEMRPTFVAFVVSFLLVGMYWVGHRDMFVNVRLVNRDVLWLNLLFLLPIAVIPFAASVLGEYSTEATALHLYGVVLVVATLMRMALSWYLVRHTGLLWEAYSKKSKKFGLWVTAGPIVVYAIAMLVAGSLPWLSLALYAAMPALYFVVITFLRSDSRTRTEAEDFS